MSADAGPSAVTTPYGSWPTPLTPLTPLAANGLAHAAVFFEGEQHGFRMAENIRAAVDGELSFYAQSFGFDLPAEEGISPIEIHRPNERWM